MQGRTCEWRECRAADQVWGALLLSSSANSQVGGEVPPLVPEGVRRVLFVLWSGKPGGAENHALRLSRFLSMRGVQVEVAFLSSADETGDSLRSLGISYRAFGMRGALDLRRLLRFVRYVSRSRAEIVHLHQATPYLAELLCRTASQPILYTEHTSLVPRGRLRRLLWSRSLRACRRLLFVSESQKVLFEARGLVDPGVGLVIPLGVDERVYHRGCDGAAARQEHGYTPDDFVVGYFGRFEAFKRIDLLLTAASRLAGDWPSLRVLVVGFGPTEDRLRALAAELGLGDVVRFVVCPSRVSELQACVDVLVHPSEHESLGLSVIEAMGMGKLVVVAPYESAREVVEHGCDGYVLEDWSVEVLQRVLLQIRCTPQRSVEMGMNAADKVVARFGDAVCFGRLSAVYRSLRGEVVDDMERRES